MPVSEALENFGSPYAVDTHALQMINTFDRDNPYCAIRGGFKASIEACVHTRM